MTRQLLHYMNADWEDVRYEHDEWMSKYKPISPFGQCPWLEFGNHKIAQSHAMNTYLANQCGLGGKTPEEQARLDMIALSIDSYIVWPASLTRREKEDMNRRAALRKKYIEEELPTAMANVNKHLEENGGTWLVGDSMTWVDMYFAHWCGWVPDGMEPPMPFDKFPKLK